jgi:hypothetical protein
MLFSPPISEAIPVPVGCEAAPTILPTVIVVPIRILEAYDGTQCKDRNRFEHPEIRHVASHQWQMMNFCCRRENCGAQRGNGPSRRRRAPIANRSTP